MSKNYLAFYQQEVAKHGLPYVIHQRIPKLVDHFLYLYIKRLRYPNTFLFDNHQHPYCLNTYNYSWKNERTIEVPLLQKEVALVSAKGILEIGNVLSHYQKISHDVVDKYEKGEKVINDDIVTFQSKKKYDLIISISTLEHIGWDEKKKDKNKIPLAISSIRKLLSPKGKFIFTIPIGYNPYLDTLLQKKEIPFDSIYYFKRLSAINQWKQISNVDIKSIKYNFPFENANVIILGVIKK